MDAFDAWVAKAIYAISGIWPEHLCAMPAQCVLTSAESRMGACQDVLPTFLHGKNPASMRPALVVVAHKLPTGETLH